MKANEKKIIELVDFITVDKSQVICYFKCPTKNKTVVSTVPFEPFDGEIKFKWSEILFHPIKSYNRYYHTPIMIYGNECHETIVLKAFKKVSHNFIWNEEENKYIYNY